ncbi:hypothetical protein [Psychromarinibacter sp. S121]|uniref:hypothetical protein n=1 Tax=Psychromarinibacter sp. S121 TaxID=3415127 RepID=UPI003C7A60F0
MTFQTTQSPAARRVVRGLVIGSVLVALAGCGVARNVGGAVGIGSASPRGANRLEVNGVTYRSKLDISGDARRDLTITVRPFRANPETALEAGRYRATVYCLRKFGSSETAWTVGPDTPIDQLPITDDSVTLRGTCTAR